MGNIYCAGENITEYDEKKREDYLKYRVGYIYQDNKLIPNYSVEQNIMSALLLAGIDQIYTKDMPRTVKVLKGEEKRSKKLGVSLLYNCTAQEQEASYQAIYSRQLRTLLVGSVLLTLLSLVVIYFYLKSNVENQRQNLVIYQLNGIRRGWLLFSYGWELWKLLIQTVTPAMLIVWAGVIRGSKDDVCTKGLI